MSRTATIPPVPTATPVPPAIPFPPSTTAGERPGGLPRPSDRAGAGRGGAAGRAGARRAAVVAGALVATLGASSVASAATPTLRVVEQPLQVALAEAPVEVTATGDGHVAWITRPAIAGGDPNADRPAELWTMRAGAAVQVARFLDVVPDGISALEVGTDAQGAPVAIVTSTRRDRATDLRLVRLDTGQVRSVSTTRSGQAIGGVGLDRGRYYYTLHAKTPGARNTSGLWRATLTGTSIGRVAKLRTSRRGEVWSDVVADRNRVAIATARRVRVNGETGTDVDVAFGTPRGTWSRTGYVQILSGGYRPVFVLGFTRDRQALVTLQEAEASDTLVVTRAPIGGGAASTVRLAYPLGSSLGSASYDATQSRVLAVGPDAQGTPSLGYTAPVFAD
ncbi:hypothetical protein [Patulibacter americanus]|uniref:hypothetical protein n=1 Tax=Patulibacter americanus TaxID=588672 RepID=UPI0003B44CEE|nr:hypothetical protein [Patulibacter americanus]